jgi:excisionase family DNA binding protein
MQTDARLTLSVREAAHVLGISPDLVYERAKRDELPAVRVGRRLRVPVRPLLDLIGMTWEEWLAVESSAQRA